MLYSGSGVVLGVLIPDLCRLSDFCYTFTDILSCNDALKVIYNILVTFCIDI